MAKATGGKATVSYAGKVKLAADTQVVFDQPLEVEDEFQSLYEVSQEGVVIVAPPFNPNTLVALSTRNNILQQCVQAMEVNVDGTGHSIEPVEKKKKQPKAPLFPPGQHPFLPQKPAPGGGGPSPDKPGPDENSSPTGASLQKVQKQPDTPQPPNGQPQPQNPPQKPVGDPQGNQDGANGEPPADPEDDSNDPERKKLEAFFKEPFPGMSMVTLRRKLRVDLEQTGQGFLEVLRNIKGEVMFLRHIDASTVRLLKLDAPVLVTKSVQRDGEEPVDVQMYVRERRFVQIVGTHRVYYREFGSSRQVSRKTGKWIDNGAKTMPLRGSTASVQSAPSGRQAPKPEELGNELLYFVVDRDGKTPYGVPRWINNLPSVLGSRKAEEFNLEFFDAGGLPPAIILIAGGAMTGPVKEQLLQHMSGRSRSKHRAAVVEVQSASGGVDSTGKVNITVERFGDSKQGDSMFQKYDEKCEEHVRVSFRLPPLFIGRSADFSFATAMVSYMIAEEQVFAPERLEFDEIINSTIVKELGVKNYKFASKPITLKNVEVMLEAVNLAKDVIDAEERVKTLNEITGTKMEYSQHAEQQSLAAKKPVMPFGGTGNNPAGDNTRQASAALGGVPLNLRSLNPRLDSGTSSSGAIIKQEGLTANEIVVLVEKWVVAAKLERGEMSDDERRAVLDFVEYLRGPERELFNKVLAAKSFVNSSFDTQGLGELTGACTHLATRAAKSADGDRMERIVKQSSEQTISIVKSMLEATLGRPVNLHADAHLELKLPERKAEREITFSDGRKAVLKREGDRKVIAFPDGRKVTIK